MQQRKSSWKPVRKPKPPIMKRTESGLGGWCGGGGDGEGVSKRKEISMKTIGVKVLIIQFGKGGGGVEVGSVVIEIV